MTSTDRAIAACSDRSSTLPASIFSPLFASVLFALMLLLRVPQVAARRRPPRVLLLLNAGYRHAVQMEWMSRPHRRRAAVRTAAMLQDS